MEKILSHLILLLVSMICMSSTGCFGGEHDPCEDGPKCESREMGTLKLAQSSDSAIPFQGVESVEFRNTQGFQAIFKAQGYLNTQDRYNSAFIGACLGCTEFYLTEKKSLTFSGQNLNYGFTYEIVKNVPEGNQGAALPDPSAIGDVLKITLGSISFAVPLSADPIEVNAVKQFKVHNSLVVGQNTYSQVYEVFMPPTSGSQIMPKQIFYTMQDGLIGYTFTNNEQWHKQ